jgi:hypothetical protein
MTMNRTMKLNLPKLDASVSYRLRVLSRCLIAIVTGFIIANLCIPIMAYGLPRLATGSSFASATAAGFLLSFVVWLLFIIYVFSAQSLKHVFGYSTLIVLVQALLILGLKLWGQG